MKLRFVGVARRQSTSPEVEQPLIDGASVGDAVGEYGFTREAEVSILVNGRVVEWTHTLEDGDEVVVVPPLVGGGGA